MHRGVVFPQTQMPPDRQAIRDFVVAADELGYDHMLAYDHVLGAIPEQHVGWSGPYDHSHPFHEPLVLFGHISALAPKMELVTGVLVLPQRQTALVAKQAVLIDLLTHGRFRLGVGVGWNPVEYHALGQDFRTRGARLEEQVELLRALWTAPIIAFEGEFHDVRGVALRPLPIQRPIPIWFGTNSTPKTLARVGRIGDGWIVQGLPDDDRRRDLETILEARSASARAHDGLGVQGRVNVAELDADQIATESERWRALGATHLAVNTMRTAGVATLDEHLASLQRAADAL
jgi:probable F420-dependent oxidoreductase